MAMGGEAGAQFEEINVTPLTDVFLVLLVIMILIAPLIDKSELENKTTGDHKRQKIRSSKAIFIDVDKQGQIAINGKFMDKGASSDILQQKIKELQMRAGREDIPVTVNADGDAKQRDVVAIMTAAAAAGIKRMRVATLQQSQY